MKFNLWQVIGVILLVGGITWWLINKQNKPAAPPAPPAATQVK